MNKIAGEIQDCHENALSKSFETSPPRIWSNDPIPMTLGQGHKDPEAKGQLYHVGARFEALIMGVLMAAS